MGHTITYRRFLKMNKATATLLVMFLVIAASCVEAKRILFYEVGASYTMEGGYSKFAKELQAKGYEVASITRGELTKESLETYDILILPGRGGDFTPEETAAIVDFVTSRGRGLFISGITGNQNLVVPLGVTMDSGTLIDTTNQIPNMDKTSFTIERFNEYPGMSSLRQGVTKIGFYTGSGMRISGTAKVMATGDADTHSDTGSFPPGSYPPLIAASMYGSGLVFMTVDAKFLSDQYIDDYNNKRLGLNIIDWLSISTEPKAAGNTTQQLQFIIAEQKLAVAQLRSQVDQCNAEKTDLLGQVGMVGSQLGDAQQQLLELQSSMIGPLSKTNWAIISLGVCILIAAIMFSRRKPAPSKMPKDEDILGELGYEMEKTDQKGQPQIPSDINKLESELDNIKL